MPRRWPSVTSSIAGTSPSTVPAAVDDGALAERDPLAEERLAAAGLRDEAHVLAVGLVGRAQTERSGAIADLAPW